MEQNTLPEPPDVSAILRAARSDPADVPALVQRLVADHGTWHASALNLVASHNCLGPVAKALLSSSVADNILSGELGARNHSGGAWIDDLDTLVVELCKRIFGAVRVEYRAMSGAQANGLALAALTRPGDTVMALARRHGGHRTYREDGYSSVLGIRLRDIPYDERADAIDLNRLEEVARRERPRLLIVGTAELLFPYPLKELRAIAAAVGARLYYDGAHILGLTAGGAFQDPLREGAEILVGSTQKTLGGPIGGLIMTTDEAAGAEITRLTTGLVSNYHNNRVAALAVSLAEMARFGRAYAAQVVDNARALATALDREGVPVVGKERGYTASHIVLLDTTALPVGEAAFKRLEEARILTTRVPLAHTYPERRGIRLGTAAVTRRGMREEAMSRIATLIGRVVTGEPAGAVAAAVTDLVRSYPDVKFCF
ncbi:MAG: aminotransferase class I/II-fold pyridoxal phosphate-dependent enzyme [Proteobacteria bacterium]|nr:aminotransferase class I/II-fold pyridoxal phosphate-dependent enzyme [Pseudomonadota bacterium]